MRRQESRTGGSDEGSALVLVLVLMVISALMILPLMDFAMAVGRANSVLSDKTVRTEAVKGGLRIALADSAALYDTCGPPDGQAHIGINLPMSGLAVPVKTQCFFIDEAVSLATTEVRYGLAAVQVGRTVPAGMLSSGWVPTAAPPTTSEWISQTSLLSVTDKIWLPNLPTHGLSPRAPVGWPMPPEFATTEYPTCTVFFPGTYPNAVTLVGPTYFASGIYYFEDTVLIKGGADVVVGGGLVEGCATDQYAAFYAVGAPSTHNINGLGATFVLGKAGHLLVDNAAGPVRVRFNKRYVPTGDAGVAPSAGVSIVSVNGKLGPDPLTDENLLQPNVIEVPVSKVGAASEAAKPQKYLPSTLVPPSVPDPPTTPIATGYLNSMQVSWTPPVNNGGSEILGYTVRVASGLSTAPICETLSTYMCVVTGLLPGPYTFTVEARNASGTSVLSVPSPSQLTGIAAEPAWTAGSPLPVVPPLAPIIDFSLTSASAVEVDVGGYVSVPQGRFRVFNPNGFPVVVNGGVVAASFDISDPRVPIPIGLENAMTQGTFKIVTETTSGTPRMVSTAVVQINEGGPFEVNSWEILAN